MFVNHILHHTRQRRQFLQHSIDYHQHLILHLCSDFLTNNLPETRTRLQHSRLMGIIQHFHYGHQKSNAGVVPNK
jgi:hypothetical protein